MTEQSKGWHAGALAVCTGDGYWWKDSDGTTSIGPEKEQLVRVTFVIDEVAEYCGGTRLEFEGWPGELYPARFFRRVDPDHSVADDAAIVALIFAASVKVSA